MTPRVRDLRYHQRSALMAIISEALAFTRQIQPGALDLGPRPRSRYAA